MGSMASDGCKAGGIEFKNELEGQLFSACQVISVSYLFGVGESVTKGY